MKSIITFFTLLLFLGTEAQVANEEISREPNNDYQLQKAKRQKKTANILAISGGSLMVAGAITIAASEDAGWFFSPGQLAGAAVFLAGGLTGLSSIPFYISAQHKKNKYYKLYPTTEVLTTPNQKTYPVAGIIFEF